MPLAYRDGTIAEHLACRSASAAFDVSHLGTVRVDGPSAFDAAAAPSQTTSAGSARAGPSTRTCSTTDASVLDDLIVWWVADGALRRDAERLQHRRVCSALGGEDVTGERAVIAVQGPRARERLARWRPRRRRWRTSRCAASTWRGRRAGSPGRATPARTASSARCRPDGGRGFRRPCWRRGAPGRTRRPRHAAPRGRAAAPRPRARAGHHSAAGGPRLGGRLGQGDRPRA